MLIENFDQKMIFYGSGGTKIRLPFNRYFATF